jgi:hypothetical protein
MRLQGIIILLFITAISMNCKKDSTGNSTPVDVAGSINITTPVTGSTFDNGFVLRTQGDMTDNNVLASAKVEIRNKTTGAILYQQTTATGNETFYRFLWDWTVTGITVDINATVKVIAIDKLGNQVFKEVDVRLLF